MGSFPTHETTTRRSFETLSRQLADEGLLVEANRIAIRTMLDEIERLRDTMEKIAKRWPCDTADTMSRLAKETLGDG